MFYEVKQYVFPHLPYFEENNIYFNETSQSRVQCIIIIY